jgi:iron complex transport system ATP-binding protein
MTICAEGLRYAYPRAGEEALRGIGLEASSGSSHALLGPNGCGKSTLLCALIGAVRPSSGRVTLGGREAGSLARREIARLVAFLPQFERMSFGLSALEYALLGRSPHIGAFSQPSRLDEEAAYRALEDAGAAGLAERRVNELSGGELQLVRIARCLAQGTPAIVMDEPTSMLDPARALSVADAIRGLAASGRTIVFSTHDAAFAAYAAADVTLMGEGAALFSGSAAEALIPERLSACFGVSFGPSGAPSAFTRAKAE